MAFDSSSLPINYFHIGAIIYLIFIVILFYVSTTNNSHKLMQHILIPKRPHKTAHTDSPISQDTQAVSERKVPVLLCKKGAALCSN